MEEKQTNLSIAADVQKKDDLLHIADLLGPEICVLKTHIDIIEDFDESLTASLEQIAKKHQFLIFEDRKFADIGNTVVSQYQGGIYHISEWAHLINAHSVPGPGIIEGLKRVGKTKGRALLLLAEMSSQGNLANNSYTEQTIKMAKEHDDFVVGFISRHKLIDDPRFLHFTPGVHLHSLNDSLGQSYLSPEEVIKKNHSDIIIVGRGIISHKDPLSIAKQYRSRAWHAYINR